MRKEDLFRLSQGKLNAYLQAHHLNHSESREVLLRYICASGKRFTISDIEAVASSEHISRATVYNAINLFVRAFIIRPVARNEHSKQVFYDLVASRENRIRMVCTKCGRETLLSDAAIKAAVFAKKYTNFEASGFTLYVYGTCKTCRVP